MSFFLLKMRLPMRMDLIWFLVAITVTWAGGLKIDLSPLAPRQSSYIDTNKRASCQGNPCQPSRPFLCQRYLSCISLLDVCDGKWDCADGFDEDPAVCSAVSRPSEEMLWHFLEEQRYWILPQLFHGADPQRVAHALTVANTVGDLRRALGLTRRNMDNIRRAVEGAMEGDERFLLSLGMPERAWPEVKHLLESLYNTGLDVWSD